MTSVAGSRAANFLLSRHYHGAVGGEGCCEEFLENQGGGAAAAGVSLSYQTQAWSPQPVSWNLRLDHTKWVLMMMIRETKRWIPVSKQFLELNQSTTASKDYQFETPFQIISLAQSKILWSLENISNDQKLWYSLTSIGWCVMICSEAVISEILEFSGWISSSWRLINTSNTNCFL